MVFFIFLNQRYQQQYADNYGQGLNVDDPHQFMGNSPRLAPYGAPPNPKWQTKFSSGTIFSVHSFLPLLFHRFNSWY